MMQRIFNKKFSGQCGFLGGSLVKNTPVNAGDAGDVGPISGLGRPPRIGNGKLLQYSRLENAMDRGPWWDKTELVTEHGCQQHLSKYPEINYMLLLFTRSRLTLCNPMNRSTPAFLVFTISWSLLKLMSIE